MSTTAATTSDLNPPVIILPSTVPPHGHRRDSCTVHVVRDDYLIGGTKQRGLAALLHAQPHTVHEFIYAGPVFGFAQVALAHVAQLVGKQATLVVARQDDGKLKPLTARARGMGARLIEIPRPNSLKHVEAAAQEYYAGRPAGSAMLLPFGLHCETFISALETSLRAALPAELLRPEAAPKRLWLVCGSATLLATLARIWPQTHFLAVQVGKKIWPDQLGIQSDGSRTFQATLYIAPEPFWERAKYQPPYPTVPSYDAKLWQFVLQHGEPGDFVWNVGAEMPEQQHEPARPAVPSSPLPSAVDPGAATPGKGQDRHLSSSDPQPTENPTPQHGNVHNGRPAALQHVTTGCASIEDCFWDFDCVPNTVFATALPIRQPPRPDLEVQRARGLDHLRWLWQQACIEKLGLPHAPPTAFDRWLYGQLALPARQCTTRDPLLKKPELAETTEVLTRELEKLLPASSYVPWTARKNARLVGQQLSTFVTASERWLRQQPDTPADMWRELESARELATTCDHAPTLMQRLQELADRVQARVRGAIKQQLALMMRQLVTEAQALCRHLGTLDAVSDGSAGDSSTFSAAKRPPQNSDVGAQPAANVSSADALAAAEARAAAFEIRVVEKSHEVRLEFDGDVQCIRPLHYLKLCQLFAKHSPGGSEQLRSAVLFCVLRRYSTLFGPDAFESAAMHAALPEAGFRLLQRRLGVCHENYASPFNCFFAKFNSAFGDTDCWLGSLGSFTDCEPKEGSFETGPPYTEEAIEYMAVHVLGLLENSVLPLSFVVFMPDWQVEVQQLLAVSRFLRSDALLNGRKYWYVVGHQHQAGRRAEGRHFELPINTRIFVLQNDAGAERWPSRRVLEELLIVLEQHAKDLRRTAHADRQQQAADKKAQREDEDGDEESDEQEGDIPHDPWQDEREPVSLYYKHLLNSQKRPHLGGGADQNAPPAKRQ